MIFVGDDWSEDHHDVEVHDEAGGRLARRRLPEGVNRCEMALPLGEKPAA